ncbi:MAG: DUF4097 domain-containing protein [Defluviitaleaceae bacterium]|nr:DUF4097 domain-containing protein [Defluviitaleaceae bacterium]
MQNEKMMVLKMLESGKITTEEASRLLQSVDAGGTVPASTGTASTPPPTPYTAPSPPPTSYSIPSSQQNPNSHSPATPPSPSTPPHSPTGSYSGGSQGRSDAHSILDDMGRRFDAFAKDWEPKLKKATATVAEKIVGGVDRISKSLSDHTPPPQHTYGTPSPYAHKPKPSTTAPGGLTEKNIEMLVEPGYNELNLSGQNGDVRIKGYNSDKITARISYKAKRAGAHIELMKLGNKYFLKYEPDDFEVVMIDAYVPERAFSVIRLDGINAQLDCSTMAADEIAVSNANGNTRLSGLAAGNLKADSSNGRFIVSNIAADSAVLENVNGVMEADELDISKLSLTNYNGPLSLLMSNFARHEEYLWNVETGNAKLNMNLPTLPDLGYHIKAHAAMSEIRLGLTGLQFLIHEPSLVEARSVHFDKSARRVKMAVETSNAPLVIN